MAGTFEMPVSQTINKKNISQPVHFYVTAIVNKLYIIILLKLNKRIRPAMPPVGPLLFLFEIVYGVSFAPSVYTQCPKYLLPSPSVILDRINKSINDGFAAQGSSWLLSAFIMCL